MKMVTNVKCFMLCIRVNKHFWGNWRHDILTLIDRYQCKPYMKSRQNLLLIKTFEPRSTTLRFEGLVYFAKVPRWQAQCMCTDTYMECMQWVSNNACDDKPHQIGELQNQHWKLSCVQASNIRCVQMPSNRSQFHGIFTVPKNRENQLSLRNNNQLKLKTQEELSVIERNLWEYTSKQWRNTERKMAKCNQPVGRGNKLRNTMISTDYAQKSPSLPGERFLRTHKIRGDRWIRGLHTCEVAFGSWYFRLQILSKLIPSTKFVCSPAKWERNCWLDCCFPPFPCS